MFRIITADRAIRWHSCILFYYIFINSTYKYFVVSSTYSYFNNGLLIKTYYKNYAITYNILKTLCGRDGFEFIEILREYFFQMLGGNNNIIQQLSTALTQELHSSIIERLSVTRLEIKIHSHPSLNL